MNGPQRSHAPLVLHEGDLLWKCWVTNIYLGVQVQVLSARRADGTYSSVVIFIREDRKGKPVARSWGKDGQAEEQVLELANDLMREVADDRLHFRLIDLSDLREQSAQFVRLREEGFETLCLHAHGHRSVREN